ncbi:MAG: SMP-30/gluconolactonase/LRE family protein [Planctomycetota bacterium]
MHKLIAASCFALATCSSSLGFTQATISSPVDHSKEMVNLKNDFGLVDGAAANGSALFVPDVKGKQLFLFRSNPPKGQTTWKPIAGAKFGYSGTFFQLGELYLAENAASRICKSNGYGKPKEFAKFEDGARPNDLVVDHRGNVYVTLTKEGEVRKITPEGAISVAVSEINTPNGITISPDGGTLYFSSYRGGIIYKAAVTEQTVGPAMRFAEMTGGDKGPQSDGMCIDRAGNVYCAGADSVWIWNAQGKLLEKLKTPERPINCTFGGQSGQDLYISTFGGMVRQPMLEYGVQPSPPRSGALASPKGKPSTRIPEGFTAKLNQVYYVEDGRKMLCDVIAKESDEAGRPAVVVVHGGGWLKGDKTKFRPLSIKLAELGYVVMSIEYRLGFEEQFPAAIHDCNAAVRYLRSNAIAFNVDPDRIAAVGGSAGGHLVGLMATGHDKASLQPTGLITQLAGAAFSTSSKLKAAVVMAGPMEIASGSVAERSKSGSNSNAINWLGKTIDEDRNAYEWADAYLKISKDDPPTLFLRGSLDNPAADLPSLTRFKEVGVTSKQVVHDGAKHGHWNRIDWMDQVVTDIHSFLNENL